ncbi:hypothetical protein NKG05_13190 [Oerskovia sp. M15]
MLPGDELVPAADVVATRAITIAAPPREVWRWVLQLGQGRGGFYSYEWLENLVGCEIRNADRIEPQWQRLAVGDEVRLHPAVALRVAAIVPNGTSCCAGGPGRGHPGPDRLHLGVRAAPSARRRHTPGRPREVRLDALVGEGRRRAGAARELPHERPHAAGIRDRAEGRVGATAA